MRGGRGGEGVPIGGEVHILNFSQYDRRLFKRGKAVIRRFTALENCYGNLNKLVEAGLASSSSSNTALLSFELAFLPIYNKSNIVNEP